jgi:hypothetical protein
VSDNATSSVVEGEDMGMLKGAIEAGARTALGEIVSDDTSGDEKIMDVDILEVALSTTIMGDDSSVLRELESLSSEILDFVPSFISVDAASSAVGVCGILATLMVRVEGPSASDVGIAKVLAGGTMGSEATSNIKEISATEVPPFSAPPAMFETADWLLTRVRIRSITLAPAGTFPSKIACTNPSALSAKIAVELSNNLCSHTTFDPSLKYPAIEFGIREELDFGANVMYPTFTSVKYVPLAAPLLV